MSFDVTVILPSELRSGYLQSEFISSGIAYTAGTFSKDPNFDGNRNTLIFSFELRSKTTRELVSLERIKTLYLSNDPDFEQSSTVQIQNFPSGTYDASTDYICNLNPLHFFDSSQSIESSRSSQSGTGLFIVNNWALSANGGLSKVYMKAIITGPAGEDAEYPRGFGLFDTIVWEGSFPVKPEYSEYSSLKSGWIGKNSLCLFKSGSASGAQISSSGVSRYVGSVYEIASIGNTADLHSINSSVKRSLIPEANYYTTTADVYKFSRLSPTSYVLVPSSLSLGTETTLSAATADRGVYLETNKKLLSSSDIFTQAHFKFNTSSIACTSQAFINLEYNHDSGIASSSITLRLDIPNDSNPTATLYTVSGYIDSANSQTTTLSNSILPMLKNGGLLEMYYSNVDSLNSYVEAYFTPDSLATQTNNQSFLLASSMMPSLGTTTVSSSFAYQVLGAVGQTATLLFEELAIAEGTSKLSVDLGTCDNDDSNGINFPVSSLKSSWATDNNEEYKILTDGPFDLTYGQTISSSSVSLTKIDSTNIYDVDGCYEIQLFRPSLSNKCSLQVKLLHKSDDFYVAFSPVSSYRPYTKNNVQIDWDRPIGTRCDDKDSYADNPIDAATIIVLFSQDKKYISVLQRNTDNSFTKHLVKSYVPGATTDTYTIEITDQVNTNLVGTKKSKNANSTWVYIKKDNGVKIDYIGYAEINQKMSSSSKGLGYFAAVGFKESSYSTGANIISELRYDGLPSFSKKDAESIASVRSFALADDGLANSKHYLGQGCLSSLTDLKGYNYSTATTNSSPTEVKLTSTGVNVDIATIATLTIDGIQVSSLSNNDYILLKDQTIFNENGLYRKVSGLWTLQTTTLNTPYKVTLGDINANTFWYKTSTQENNTVAERFVSTTYFKDINIGQISNFVSSIRPLLFEFKMNWLKYNKIFPLSDLRIRFFQDDSGSPDADNPLTNWLDISYNPFSPGFIISPNTDLVQVVMANSASESPLVSQSDKIWVAISLPFNTSLAEANGKNYVLQDYLSDGKFSGYKLAKNLWHKLYSRYEEKTENLTHKNYQQFRVRTVSHSNISSHATDLSAASRIDANGPQYNNSVPLLQNTNGYNLRTAALEILASDNDSGIMSFRVGKEIDNSRIQYTPWLSWSQYVVNNNGKYYVYLYGDLNYYDNGITNSTFDLQNVGYSGIRKVWVQLMDYVGNVSESYPLTFVATSYAIVDTEPPIGTAVFYDPRTYNSTTLSNLLNSFVKINAFDTVSDIKDYKVRRIYDSGPGEWSEWEYFNPYRVIDFTGEKDGVKRVEFAFRDFGNNITQPQILWESVTRANK